MSHHFVHNFAQLNVNFRELVSINHVLVVQLLEIPRLVFALPNVIVPVFERVNLFYTLRKNTTLTRQFHLLFQAGTKTPRVWSLSWIPHPKLAPRLFPFPSFCLLPSFWILSMTAPMIGWIHCQFLENKFFSRHKFGMCEEKNFT